MKAKFNGKIIAESDKTVVHGGYVYFPYKSVNMAYLTDTDHSTVCPHKGTARYFNVVVFHKKALNAAWIYPVPNDGYEQILNHIAFNKNIEIE